jgi:hypothetical protein
LADDEIKNILTMGAITYFAVVPERGNVRFWDSGVVVYLSCRKKIALLLLLK